MSNQNPKATIPPESEKPAPSSERHGHRGVYYSTPAHYGSQYYQGYGYPYATPYYGESSGPASWLGELSLRRLYRIARTKWLTIVLSTIFVLLLGVFQLHRTPRIYQASALVEMTIRQPRIMSREGAFIDEGTAPMQRFNTRLELFRGPAMRALAYEVMRDSDNHDLLPSSPGGMPGLRIDQVRQSNLLSFRVTSRDPALAAAAANAYAQAAEIAMERENRETSDMAVAWLQSQAATQRAAVERAEKALIEYRETIDLDALQSRAAVARATLESSSGTLAGIRNQMVLNQELLNALDTAELTPESIERIPQETPFAGGIVSALERLSEARHRRDRLRTRYTEQHPDYIAADEEVTFARERVTAAHQQARETVQANGRLLAQQAAELERSVERLGAESASLEIAVARAQSGLSSRKREREAADTSYRGILNRIEQARLSADENTASVKRIQDAGVPGRPISPAAGRMLGMAGLFGLALGGIFALLKDVFDDLLQHDEDVERTFGVKALSVVPQLNNVKRGDVARMCHTHKHSHFAESFAGLRALLDAPEYREQSKVLLVTSTVPEVGKTICSSNLAISFAKRGERTLIIDFDMRRPQLRRIFDIPEAHESLLHVLSNGDVSRFENLPFKTDIENVEVVVSRRGGKELSAAEILGRPFVRDFIDWARAHYDRVILDSPPFGIVGDAMVLAGMADGVIMVLRPGKTRKSPARNAVRHLQAYGAQVHGSIVNALDFKKATYFSNYDYHYSHYRYGYGNHYGENAGKAEDRKQKTETSKGSRLKKSNK